MSAWAAKRFWKAAQVSQQGDGFAVTLDGRAVKTPAKTPLVVPTRALADAIAAEWDAQEETINPLSMPCTRSANAALDKVTLQHGEVADMLAAYGDTDLLCYRADGPEALIARQAQAWDPILDWAAQVLNARLVPVAGLMHAPQNPDALATLRGRVHDMDAFALAAFHDLVGMSGSLILGFAVAENHLDAQTAWQLSRVDENWQEEQWGMDQEAADLAETKRQQFEHASRFYRLLRCGNC